MNKLTKLALTATLTLAITLTLTACEEKKKQDGTTATEPAAEAATQQAATQEATQEAVVEEPKVVEVVKGSFTDERDDKTYKTAKIGTQVWMAENLNFEAKGSKCYDNKPDNCKKYGRLYDWNTAKNACPSGWKLPSKDEWQTLVNFAGGNEVAGKKLKAKSGWGDNNGTDEYGFSALSGGNGIARGVFDSIGEEGNWWSSSEDNSNNAYYKGISYENEFVSDLTIVKSNLFSVRCIQN